MKSIQTRISSVLFAGLLVFTANARADLSGATTINATDTIYDAAGNATSGDLISWGATAPVDIALGADSLDVTFSDVDGSITYNGGGNFNDPDGNGSASTNDFLNPFGSLSGIYVANAGALVGVFVDGTPTGGAPSALDFESGGIGTAFTSLSPALNQVFFIGDGLTGDGSGSVQDFVAPTGATDLYLGFVDAPGYNGGPGSYGDNSGSFTANYDISSSVPSGVPDQPSDLNLLAAVAGLVFFAAGSKRKAGAVL